MNDTLEPFLIELKRGPKDLGAAVRWSIIVHVALLVFFTLQSLIFPSNNTPFIPSLRVDLVALPDLLKQEKMNLSTIPEFQEEDAKPVKSETKETAAAEEMVLNPKEKAKEAEARAKKLKNSLARMKSLSKILSDEERPQINIIKGNLLSKGASLAGDARESAAPSYLDLVHQRLLQNWSLPVWLARQQLAAQIRIFIDDKGNLVNYIFVKPSGNEQFDEAVKQALVRAAPFPRPTPEVYSSLQSNGILIGFPL